MRTNISLTVILLPLFLWSCGAATNGAPNGSTITFYPAGISWLNINPTGGCVWSNPKKLEITVKDASGAPINNATISVFVDTAFVQLYDDANNNGALDASETTPVGGTLDTKTENFGSKSVFIAVRVGGTGCINPGGLKYSTDVSVYSGGAYGISTQTVTTN